MNFRNFKRVIRKQIQVNRQIIIICDLQKQ